MVEAKSFRLATISESGTLGLLNNTDFLRNPLDENGMPMDNSDFEWIPNKLNNGNKGFNVSGKLDFKPTMNLNLTFGGSYSFSSDDYYIQDFSLMSWDHMPKV